MIHVIPELQPGDRARCTRCTATIVRHGTSGRAAGRTAAAAVGAFFLYWPAVLLPVLEVEKLGHRQVSSVLGGTIDLLRHGNWFVGGVILLFSIVFPLTKIVLLIELSLFRLLHRRFRAWTCRIMEHAGKWSMMDVMLLAFLVMLVKLGSLVEFHVGSAAVAFALCVLMSMTASLCFDPHAIWEDDVQEVGRTTPAGEPLS